MARLCVDCGLDLDRFGERHRCTTKIVGARKATRLEAEQIAKGQLDPASLLLKNRLNSEPVGRLARRTPVLQPDQKENTASSRGPQTTLTDVLQAIDNLRRQFEKLQAALTSRS